MTATSPSPQPPGEMQPDILIVDDEESNLHALSRFFEERGWRTRAFSDATEALSEIGRGFAPALVISDLRMPGMNGLQFVEHLRAARVTAPIIILTAHGDIDSYFRFFSLGVFEFIHKPVRDTELERIVRNALQKGGAAA